MSYRPRRSIAWFAEWTGPGAIERINYVKEPDQLKAIPVLIENFEQEKTLTPLFTLMAATSANLSGAPNTSTAKEALQQLDGRIEPIIDGGPCQGGVPSTVVNCSQAQARR